MASSDSTSSSISLTKENLAPTQSKLQELNESRTELLSRIQNLKQDMRNWRCKLDNQVKSYRNELTELRESLSVEVGQLRSEFQELRTTLQQQQEEVSASLKNLGLQDPPKDAEIAPAREVDGDSNKVEAEGDKGDGEGDNVDVNPSESPNDETNAQEVKVEGNDTGVHIPSTENDDENSSH